MQAGAFHALDDEDWIFPSYRESAIGLLRGMPAGDGALVVARTSRGLVEPGGLQRRVDLRSDRDARAARGRARLGEEAEGRARVCDRLLRRRRDLRGRVPRRRELRRRHRRAADPLLQQQRLGDLDSRRGADARARHLPTRLSATASRGCAWTETDVLACYEATREAVTRARAGEGPTFIEAVSYRTAPHATADDPRAYIDLERVEEEKKRECVGRFEGYLRRAGILARRSRRVDQRRGRGRDARGHQGGGGGARRRRRAAVLECVRRSARVVRLRSRRAARHAWLSVRIVEAINDCFHVELERDASVMVMGEDVGRAGGVFRATAGLRDRFGPDRCVDTPLAEAGILGAAVGLCMAGWRPVCEMQYDAFSYPCLDQLITHVGRYRWRTGGKMEFPLVVRMPYGGGVRAPELHDDSPETYYVHTPGVKVAIPSTPADAKGLLAAAIRDPDPVVILEPKLTTARRRARCPRASTSCRSARRASRARATTSRSSRTARWSPLCEAAADALDGRGVRRGARHPLAEAARRGRAARVGGEDRPRRDRAGGAAHVRASAPSSPRSSPRRRSSTCAARCCASPATTCPYPYWQIEDAYMPSVERVVDAARRLLEFWPPSA